MQGQNSNPTQTLDNDIKPDIDLPLELVHRILLTDTTHFDTLRTTTSIPNLTFQQFRSLVLHNDDATAAVKRAFHDHIKESIEIGQSWLPLYNLLLELHTAIRSLVPNRPDLHSTLQDPLPPDAAYAQLFEWETKIVHAARSLAQLESPLRSETTCQWISSVENTFHKEVNGNSPSHDWSFWILSLLYLVDKAELCSQEKNDFYLTQVVAPRLHSTGEGFLIERREFENKFSLTPPLTQRWIQTLVEPLHQQDKENLRKSSKERQLLVTTGWIQSILFQTEHPTQLPEIFSLDFETLQAIRKVTRTAAAGCSLGWHALQALGRPITVNHTNDSNNLLQDEQQGALLVQTMKNIQRYSTIQAYEEAVADSLIALTQNWNNGLPLQPTLIETLRGQTQAVLRGEDPVLRLLDDRMKKLFVALAKYWIHGLSGAPLAMQTGQSITGSMPTPTGSIAETSFIRFARQEVCKAGLAFYSHDLAQAAQSALKVPDLAYQIYSHEFLDQMILDAM